MSQGFPVFDPARVTAKPPCISSVMSFHDACEHSATQLLQQSCIFLWSSWLLPVCASSSPSFLAAALPCAIATDLVFNLELMLSASLKQMCFMPKPFIAAQAVSSIGRPGWAEPFHIQVSVSQGLLAFEPAGVCAKPCCSNSVASIKPTCNLQGCCCDKDGSSIGHPCFCDLALIAPSSQWHQHHYLGQQLQQFDRSFDLVSLPLHFC